MKRILLFGLCSVVASTLAAAELQVELELPDIDSANYRRPYVAMWLERPDRSVAANLVVWYDHQMRDDEGETWLKDMRLWWRRSGRSLNVPVDGLTSATRAPGTHTLTFAADDHWFEQLKPGEYEIVVEAAREHGGREVVKLPLQWPIDAPTAHTAEGEHELGRITLRLEP